MAINVAAVVAMAAICAAGTWWAFRNQNAQRSDPPSALNLMDWIVVALGGVAGALVTHDLMNG